MAAAVFPYVKPNVRRTMQGNRSSETVPEVRLRKALWAANMRGYRKNYAKLPGRPDIWFGKANLAVFLHGCFWHCCPKCYDRRWREPKTNTRYWDEKLKRNRDRDQLNRKRLADLGVRILVLWECDIKGDKLEAAVQQVKASLAEA